MNSLITTHLKHLLSQATPGPWEYDPGEQKDERCIVDAETWNMCINPTSNGCLLYTSPSPRDGLLSRMPSSA